MQFWFLNFINDYFYAYKYIGNMLHSNPKTDIISTIKKFSFAWFKGFQYHCNQYWVITNWFCCSINFFTIFSRFHLRGPKRTAWYQTYKIVFLYTVLKVITKILQNINNTDMCIKHYIYKDVIHYDDFAHEHM